LSSPSQALSHAGALVVTPSTIEVGAGGGHAAGDGGN
jgi:hypothetical protein